MKNKNFNKTCIGIVFFVIILSVSSVSYGLGKVTRTYDVGGQEVRVKIISSPVSTILEGRIKEESGFYFFKMNFMGNFFSINVPQRSYDKMTEQDKNDLIASILLLYGRSFMVAEEMLGYMPKGYRFNVTLGQTQSGYPFNRVYNYSKSSNIYPNFLPFESTIMGAFQKIDTPMTELEESVMLHEIGHSIFAIAIGTIQNPKNKYMEEGFVDYFADKVLGKKSFYRQNIEKITVTNEEISNMSGLSQLDVDVSIWGEEVIDSPTMEGYVGVTHHHFGYEFIRTYIDIFGDKDLRGFLDRFKQTEDRLDESDYGTKRVNDILLKMGYSPEKISDFQEKLHERLRQNVFYIKE
jgi:hypothetical protein